MRKALKIIRKILFWIFFVSLFITTVLTVILYVYEDDIKRYALDELNERLNSEIEVQDIDLSIFSHFPYASLEFEKIFIKDAFAYHPNEDTLFFAEKMYYNFNVWDIWNGDYKVKRISVHEGQLNLKTTTSGDVNYDIVKKSTDSHEDTSNFEFNLELLKVENLALNYANLATQQFYQLDVVNGLFQGDFTESEYEVRSESEIYIRKLKSNSFSLVRNKRAVLDAAMDINMTDKKYVFKKGDLTIEEMPFTISGWLDSSNMDLSLTGNNIQLEQLANSLIDESLSEAKRYEGKGEIDFNARIHGGIDRDEMPAIEAGFKVENGSVIEPENNLTIHSIYGNGTYQNAQEGREEELLIPTLNFKTLNSHFQANGNIVNFSEPIISLKTNGVLDLGTLHQFFKFEGVDLLKGIVEVDLASKIQFFDPEYRKDKFEILASDGSLILKNIAYQETGESLVYQSVNGEITILGKDAAAENLSISTENSDLVLNGAMKNFIPFIDGTGALGLIASIESEHLDLNEFMPKSAPVDQPSKPEVFALPDNLNLNIELDIGHLYWDDHFFDQISGQFFMANKKASLKNFKVTTLGGTAYGNLALNNLAEEGSLIEGKINCYDLNVSELFKDWDNFDQNTITDQQISGRIKGELDLMLFFDKYFNLLENKLYANSQVLIQNGALVQVETMKEITNYMRSNKALKLMLNKHIDNFEEKLMNLTFTDLSNNIEIKDRKIHIPKMIIQNNAVDVSLFGWHDFDNNIEYHFAFRFRELKSAPETTEFGKVTDDGLGIVIYLTMSGNIDDPVFALDKDERKNNIKEELVAEKQTFKSILKTEFGLFKKDSSVQKMEEKNKNEVEFIYYDDQIESVDTPVDTTKKKRNNGRVNNFIKKIKENGKKEEDNFEVVPDDR